MAVKRQTVEVFIDHDIGDQARSGSALLDRQIGCRCLDDARATVPGGRGEFLTVVIADSGRSKSATRTDI